MNTKFKVLWFEDEVYWYNMEKLRIEAILREHNLLLDEKRVDGDEFNISEITGNDYDLILMDYKLAEGTTGDTIVAALRENDVLTDILFYSSEEANMLGAIRAKMPPIDGVYLTKRDYVIFTEKVKKIISKIVRRSEDVVNLRGFVLDNSSDFEVRIKEILNVCWNKFDTTEKSMLTDAVVQVLDNKAQWIDCGVRKAKQAEFVFSAANNDKYLLGIADRLQILDVALSVLFSRYGYDNMNCPKMFKDYYTRMVSRYRNKLGHITLGEKTISIEGKDVPIDQTLHRQLRKNISEVDAKIKSIEDFMTMRM